MGIKELEKRIIKEIEQQAAQILLQARQETEQLEREHQNAVKIKQAQILGLAQKEAEGVYKSVVVPARLKAKNQLLEEKQKMISGLYAEVKKQKKLSDAELESLREKTEIEVGKILYG